MSSSFLLPTLSTFFLFSVTADRAPERKQELQPAAEEKPAPQPPLIVFLNALANRIGCYVRWDPQPKTPPGEAFPEEAPPESFKNKKIRAWVNGKAIYEEEFQLMYSPALARKAYMSPDDPETKKLLAEADNQLVDRELLCQDAVAVLLKNNRHSLVLLQREAARQYDIMIQKIVANAVQDGRDEAQIRKQLLEVEWILKRKATRELIAREYLRSKIMPRFFTGGEETEAQKIEKYYDEHPEEFRKPETVEWQDVFIAIDEKRPTLAEASAYAGLLLDLAAMKGFDEVLALDVDDGDSKYRGGRGLGKERGQIRPPEVEEHLFKLRDGQIGPPVELSTGVHIIRMVKHEQGGSIPFDDEVRQKIQNRLRQEIFETEAKELTRGLRAKAEIRMER